MAKKFTPKEEKEISEYVKHLEKIGGLPKGTKTTKEIMKIIPFTYFDPKLKRVIKLMDEAERRYKAKMRKVI